MTYATDQIIVLLKNDEKEFNSYIRECKKFDEELTEAVHNDKVIRLREAEYDRDSFFETFDNGRLVYIKFRMGYFFKEMFEEITEKVEFRYFIIQKKPLKTIEITDHIESVLRSLFSIAMVDVDWLVVGQHFAETYLEHEKVRLEKEKEKESSIPPPSEYYGGKEPHKGKDI